MWYLADTAAVSGDETDLLPDEHLCSRTEGTLNQRRAVKFVKATEARMEEVGCDN
jgi:hypothetical protein